MISPAIFLLVVSRVEKWSAPLSRASLFSLAATSLVSTIIVIAMFGVMSEWISPFRAAAVTAQAVIPPALLVVILIVRKYRVTTIQSVWLHWCALLWLSWSAFPWVFELL
jgi:hypothetical protein